MPSTGDKQIHGLIFGDITVEPWENRVRVDGIIQIFNEIPKNEPLLSCSVRRDPKPTVPKIVVHEENVPFLER